MQLGLRDERGQLSLDWDQLLVVEQRVRADADRADIQDDAIEVEEDTLAELDVGAVVTEERRLHPDAFAALGKQVAENAAFNPSMSPLEQAVVNLVIGGGRAYADIADAVLVEVAGSKASQIDATKDVLATITNVPLRIFQA